MKLYTFSKAPSPLRLYYFMKEKEIEIDYQIIDMISLEHKSDEFKKINPDCTLPTLILDDGTVLCEVIAICNYLEEKYPKIRLLGKNAIEKALIAEWDHKIEVQLYNAIAEVFRNQGDVFKNRALPGKIALRQIPELIERGKVRTLSFYETLDNQLNNQQFIAGKEFSLADISAFTSINFARWVKLYVNDEFKNIHRWLAEIMEKPSMKKPDF